MMVSKEEMKLDDTIEAFSWWPCDATENHRRHYQSHWLQANLSEVEEKIKVMVSIIEEDGDSFAKRAEMYYKRRPQLLKILDDLHRSYRCLAEKYDQIIIRSHSARLNHFIPPSSSSSSSKPLTILDQLQPEKVASSSNSSSCIANNPYMMVFEVAKDDNCCDISTYAMQQVLSTDQVPCKTASASKEKLPETPHQTVFELREKRYNNNNSNNNTSSTSDNNINVSIHDDHDDHLELVCLRRDHKTIMAASELIAEHLRQQAELVKRNEEKRVKIKELCSQIKKLMAENEALKRTSDLKTTSPRPSPIPKLLVNNNNKDANKPKGTLFQLAKLTGCSR